LVAVAVLIHKVQLVEMGWLVVQVAVALKPLTELVAQVLPVRGTQVEMVLENQGQLKFLVVVVVAQGLLVLRVIVQSVEMAVTEFRHLLLGLL
jgi:hypothetical protein